MINYSHQADIQNDNNDCDLIEKDNDKNKNRNKKKSKRNNNVKNNFRIIIHYTEIVFHKSTILKL